MERELEKILIECRKKPVKNRDYAPIYSFFKRVIQTDQKIIISDSLAKLMGFLSTADDGLIWPIAKNTLVGYKPEMIVPPLQITREKRLTKRPVHHSLSARGKDLPTTMFIKPPKRTVPRARHYKTVSDREILPELIVAPEANFYYCTPRHPRTARMPSSLSYKVHKNHKPIIAKNMDVETFNSHGIFKVGPDKLGNFLPLNNFLHYKEQVYMAQQLPVFQNWFRNKAFIKWYYLFRMRRHKRTTNIIKETCPFESTTFVEVFLKLRTTIFTFLKECHPISKDMPIKNFTQLKQNSDFSLKQMNTQFETLNEQLRKELEHFFEQIRGIAFLLRSDYDVLKNIGALPKSMIPYCIEDCVNSPSITSIRIRNKLLFKERCLSHARKEYLPRFFTMIRLFMRDFTIKEVSSILDEFYSLFNEDNPTTQNLVSLNIDSNIGLCMNPTVDEFLEWFDDVDKRIQQIFDSNSLKLSDKAIESLYLNEDGTCDRAPDVKLSHDNLIMPEVIEKCKKAKESIKRAYDYFDRRLEGPREFFIKTIKRIESIKGITEYKNAEDFMMLMNEFKETRENIEHQQRMFTFGSFYTDMKDAKMNLMKSLQSAMEGTKSIGIVKSQEVFENLQEHRRKYITDFASVKVPLSPSEKKTRKELLITIQTLSNEYMTICTSLQCNWTEGLADIYEKQEIVKEVLGFAQNALKRKRVKKRVKKMKEEDLN